MTILSIEAVVAYDIGTMGIGSHNQLLWKLPKDMAHFKALTQGHAVLMGRQTAISIGRALPGRTNFVLSHSDQPPFKGQQVVQSLQEAVNCLLALTDEGVEVVKLFIIGGQRVYEELAPYITVLHTTAVEGGKALATPDRFFTEAAYLSPSTWKHEVVLDGDDASISTVRTVYTFTPVGPAMLSLPKGVTLQPSVLL